MEASNDDILSVLCGQNDYVAQPFDPEVMAFRNKVITLQQTCPDIEWEHEMGAIIPFCKLDNKWCNGQCVFKTSSCPCEEESGEGK